jgi:electron transfer flavoprotein alpha subunit
LVYSEDINTVLELVTLGTRLGKDTSVALLGHGDQSSATKKVSVKGVSTVYQVSNETLKDLLVGPIVDALEAVYQQSKPDLVLVGSTKRGRDIAAKFATRLGIGCINDAVKLQLNGSDTTAERLVWGAESPSSPKITSIDFQPKTNRVVLVGKKEKPRGEASLKDAQTVVSAGRGFKKKEDLAILDDLVKMLNGVMGVSRPLASDLGWVSEERQVGLTGTTVKPKLYVAVGISGQIQHLTGMRDSKVVVAINSDKNAPIFQECDYGLVGDLYQVVPELVKALKTKLGR